MKTEKQMFQEQYINRQVEKSINYLKEQAGEKNQFIEGILLVPLEYAITTLRITVEETKFALSDGK